MKKSKPKFKPSEKERVPADSAVKRDEYALKGRIWIEGKDGTFLGYGRVVLLERIREYGSISEAAKSMGMSYRHAWELIDSINRQSKEPLVETVTGGKGGGGARLTDTGERAVSTFRDLYARLRSFLEKEMTIFSLVIAVLLSFLLPQNAAVAGGRSITVAAAADLSFAFKDIAAGFEKETGIKVIFSFGSTGMLAKQISEGAPFDLFFAADRKHLEDLSGKGHVIPSSVERYALGAIVLAVNRSSGIEVKDLRDLLKPEIKSVAIANPDHAPYGRAAMEALKSSGLLEGLKDKLVYGENIRQTLQFIQTGNAQAGIVALSVANVPEITYVKIDPSLHNPIDQAMGIVKTSKDVEAATSFIRYVRGSKGSEVMKKYGFIIP